MVHRALIIVLAAASAARGQGLAATFVPQWRLGDRWDVAVEYTASETETRTGPRTNLFRFKVQAMEALAPGVRLVHLEARPKKRWRWQRAHLVFAWRRPGRLAPGAEQLWLSRVTLLTVDDPPRRLSLDFAALTDDPHPVLAANVPLPLTFPVFELRPIADPKTFRPRKRAGAPRELPAIRQDVQARPALPEAELAVKADRDRLLAYRLSLEADPLVNARQLWHPAYPWCVFERAAGRYARLKSVKERRGDPMALVERAAAYARDIGTPREAGSLRAFRLLLTESQRSALERRRAGPDAPAAEPDVVTHRTQDVMAGFLLPGFTATMARMTGGDTCLVRAGGVRDHRLESVTVFCQLEAGAWRIASGAQAVAVTSRPAPPAGAESTGKP